jgi:FixJ family two-component response regulator
VTDRRLPGLSGDALAQKALELRPGLEIVFATGEAAAVPDIALPGAVFLVKPYAVTDLARALTGAIVARARREVPADASAASATDGAAG